MKDKEYKELLARHGAAEVAAHFVFPAEKTKSKPADDAALSEALRARRVAIAPDDRLRMDLLQLRYQIEDYINDSRYDSTLSFQHFLEAYILDLGIKRHELARDLSIRPSALSQYLNAHRLPPIEVLVRLELHSGQIISAAHWYQLIEKEKIHQLSADRKIRREQMPYIKKSKYRVKMAHG
ncbi:MAG: helix-turn-helix transcriptional regulator [Bacteroidetes bacterium]|nr:helix-turn-helix transcriptional regulator [Bacteroidota bacterium]